MIKSSITWTKSTCRQKKPDHCSTLQTSILLINYLFAYYHTQWTAVGSGFGAISLWFFVCVWNISGTDEWICARFTRKTCLVPHSDEVKGRRSRSPGTKTAFFSPFGDLHAVCVWYNIFSCLMITTYSELHKVLFRALSVTFLFVYEISRELLNGFALNSQGRHVWSLARTSLNVNVKGQGHKGQKWHFSALSAACVWFVFGKTSLASS